MKAIMILFDSLKRDWLPPYGGDIIAPNFERLARHAATFDNFYVGSLPCMPARRELHTGRYNFLHEGWSPLEPFDDSVPQMLREAGIHTHLVADHHHYWREGGANYHTRYTTNEHIRGQEGDPWKGDMGLPYRSTAMNDQVPPPFDRMFRQDCVNRAHMATEETHCQTLTFDAGLEFLNANHEQDNWFLQIESFDPHEPFYTFDRYRELYPSGYEGRPVDWPSMGPVTQAEEYVAYVQNQYKALVTQLDGNLGRVLDAMDAYGLWEDTLLIVNTDHGLLLGEHEWWSKGVMPAYNEIARIPFFCWDPRSGARNVHRRALAQNIDAAATLLEYFDLPLPKDMEGRPLRQAVATDAPGRPYALFGYHGGMTNITDGRYVYMHAPASRENAPLYEYTLIPARMNSRAPVSELQDLTLAEPFAFTKGCRTLRINMTGHGNPFGNMHRFGCRLYDLENDPGQRKPIRDRERELILINAMVDMMQANDAPAEQYERMGVHPGMTAGELEARDAAFERSFAPPVLPGLEWERCAVSQYLTLKSLMGGKLDAAFEAYIQKQGRNSVRENDVVAFARETLPPERAGFALMLLQQARQLD